MKIVIVGKRSNLTKSLENQILKKNYKFKTFSSKDILKLNSKDLKNSLLVINSFYPFSKKNRINYDEYLKINILNLNVLLTKAIKYKAKKIIYSSSSGIYLFQDKKIDVDNNSALYESCKLFCENLVIDICKKNSVNYIITRIFNIFGNNDEGSIIKLLQNKKKKLIMYNKGKSIRDYIHVEDVAKIYVKLINSNYNGKIDIGTGKGKSTLQIFKYFGISKKRIINKKRLESHKSLARKNNFFLKNYVEISNFISNLKK